ncbi:DUF6020 family protein [Luteococcus japonicus]|nr:DUF6020 family protein [Luteococcus japonicus]
MSLSPSWRGREVPVLAVLCGLALAVGHQMLNRPLDGGSQNTGPLVFPLVWALTTWVLCGIRTAQPRREWLVAVPVAAVMGALRLVGHHFTPHAEQPFRRIGWQQLPEFLVDWAVMLVCWLAVQSWLRRPRAAAAGARGRHRWVWPGSVVLMLAVWSGYLLLFWPGILVRDSWSSLFLGQGEWPMNNHHPVLFSLWVGQCLRFAHWAGGGTSLGVAIFSVVQAVVMACVLATVVSWLWARVGRRAAGMALLFFALSPQLGMWSVTMHKDSLFVCWVALLALLFTQAALRGSGWLTRPWPMLGLLVLLLAISFSRNNGPYIAVGIAALVVLWTLPGLRGASRGRTALAVLCQVAVLASVFWVQGPLYRQWGVVPGEYAETVGLPLHQVSWSVVHGQATSEQLLTYWWMIPPDRAREVFNPAIVDSVKFDRQFDTAWLNEHPEEFMGLWRDMRAANHLSYASAWFGLAGGYVDPERFFTRFDVGTERGAGHFADELPRTNLFGELREENSDAARLARIAGHVASWPGVSLLFAMPLLFWLCLMAAARALLDRRSAWVLPFAPFLLCVGTLLLAAPVTDFRYVAAGHVALPVLVAAAWLMRPVREMRPEHAD